MKDVISCDKLRRAANTLYHPEISEWGNLSGVMPGRFILNQIRMNTQYPVK
jgi:hypothetical protein